MPLPDAARHATPLWVVLTFTFLTSIGSAIIYGGIFFLAKSRYNFTTGQNFGLALLYGLTYIPGAMGAGPLQRALRARGITPRAILGWMMVLMAMVCLVPWICDLLAPKSPATWPIWVTIAVYAPASGMMWPIVEAFLAGGRTENQLRSATGQFNVVWSGAIVVTMLAIGRFIETSPLTLLLVLAGVHLACIGLVLRFDAAPATHEHHEHHRPLAYRQLLAFLRIMLPVSFMFMSTLSPYMPTVLTGLNVPLAWQTAVAATWYTARVLTFFVMERWHGWHGRWTTPIVGSILLLVSFAWVVLLPMFAPAGLGLCLFLIGLVGFGVGVGMVYAAALYYAMEVGSSGVDAGGTHEALIGMGYAAGPLCGLAGLGAVAAHLTSDKSSSIVTVAIVATIAIAAGGFALAKAAKIARSPGRA
jgi:hypothetical protein